VQEAIEYILNQCCNILPETVVIDPVTSITTESNTESQRQRKILRLERRLSRLSKIIRELEEKDMSLDEMAHCDLYEVESNLKKEACEVK
jgi:exonuclease VII small subunit